MTSSPEPRFLPPADGDFPDHSAIVVLLKAPGMLLRRIERDQDLPAVGLQMLAWGLLFHAAYGFAMGLFGSLDVALVAAVKAPLIAGLALLLCTPTLYVFAAVGATPLRLSQAGTLAAAVLAMTGLLLLGLAPVAWLFSVSTASVPFVVLLNLAAWSVAIAFALRFLRLLRRQDGPPPVGPTWWLVVYVLVSLQMATVFRPLLTPAESWFAGQKKSFAVHFADSMDGTGSRGVR